MTTNVYTETSNSEEQMLSKKKGKRNFQNFQRFEKQTFQKYFPGAILFYSNEDIPFKVVKSKQLPGNLEILTLQII